MKTKKNLNKNPSTSDALIRENIQISKQQLNKKFDQLYEQSTKWKVKKQHMKEQRELAKSLQEQKICTFKPTVNPQLFFQSKQSFLKRQTDWMNKKQRKVLALIQQSEKKIKKQCSFQPKTIKPQRIFQKTKIQKNYNNIYKGALKSSSKNSYKAIHNNRLGISNKSSTHETSLSSSRSGTSHLNKKQNFIHDPKQKLAKESEQQIIEDQGEIKIQQLNDQDMQVENKQRLSTDCDFYKQENKQEQDINSEEIDKTGENNLQVLQTEKEGCQEGFPRTNEIGQSNYNDQIDQIPKDLNQDMPLTVQGVYNKDNTEEEVQSDSQCI